MHHLVTSSLCLGLFLYPAYLEVLGPVRAIAVAQNSTPEPRDPIRAESEGAESPQLFTCQLPRPRTPSMSLVKHWERQHLRMVYRLSSSRG